MTILQETTFTVGVPVLNAGQTLYTEAADETWKYNFGAHRAFASVRDGPVTKKSGNEADDRVTIFSRPDDSPPRGSSKFPPMGSLLTGKASRLAATSDWRSSPIVTNSPENVPANNGHLASSTSLFMQPRSDVSRHATPLERTHATPWNDRRHYLWNEIACSVSSMGSSRERMEDAIPSPPTPPVSLRFGDERFVSADAAGCSAAHIEPTPLDTETTLSPSMATALAPGEVLQAPDLGSVGMGEPQSELEAVFQYKCPFCDFVSPAIEEAANHCSGSFKSCGPSGVMALDESSNNCAAYPESSDPFSQDVEYNKYACPVCGFLTPDFDTAARHCPRFSCRGTASSSCKVVLREATVTSRDWSMNVADGVASFEVGETIQQADGSGQEFEYNKYSCPVCGFLTSDFNEAITHCSAGVDTSTKPNVGGVVYTAGRVCVDAESNAEDTAEHAAPTYVFANTPVWGPPVMGTSAQAAVDIPVDSSDVGGSSTQVGRCSVGYESPGHASQSQAPMMQKFDLVPQAADGQTGAQSPTADAHGASATSSYCQINYRCPKCGVLLPSFDAAVNHCSENLQTSRTTTPTHSAEPLEGPDLFSRTSGPIYATHEGCSGAHAADVSRGSPTSYSPDVPVGPRQAAAAPVEADSEPTLMRQYDPETGRHKTVVRNADGSKKAFGFRTVNSLVENNEDETVQWMSSLTEAELKGLLSEVTDHVSEGAKNYMSKKAEVERLNLQVSYAYFGLSEDADEKELDNAYRQLARRMHPDKNGGTEDAKQKFQNMKAHYEALKQGRLEGNRDDCENRSGQEEGETGETSGGKPVPQESDQGQQGQKGMGLLELLASNDRGALDQAVMEMRAQLKTIRQHMDILASEQQRLCASMGSRAS